MRVNRACARARQIARQGCCNAELTDEHCERWCATDAAGERLLEQAVARFHLSARARQRIVKLARTIADLDSGAGDITAAQLGEAVMLRCLDRERLASVCP